MTVTRRQALLGMAVSATCATAPATEAGISKIDLFQAGEQGYEVYRIPGMVVTPKGTVLAFCEARKSSRGGKTWSPRRKIADVPGPHQKNPVALAQKLASSDERTYNNPLAIAGSDGTVHFLFCLEYMRAFYMRAFYMRSTDQGKTFSSPVEITSAFD